ncbi:MAG: hypothetical protein RBG13Loki_0713, partial [Promethearchaeota archaeon CR_4]
REQTTGFPIIVVGTKTDLEPERKVKLDEAVKIAGKYNLPDVLEVSAKTGQNVGEAFSLIARLMAENVIAQSAMARGSARVRT